MEPHAGPAPGPGRGRTPVARAQPALLPSSKEQNNTQKARGAGPKLRTEEPGSGAGSQAGPYAPSLSLSRHCREEATEVAGPAGRSRGRPSPARGLGTGTSRCRGATEGFSCFPATPGLAGCSQVFPALHPQHTHACTRTHTRTRPAPTAGPHRWSPALRARPSARPPVRLPQRLCGQGWVTPGADRACAPGSEDTHKVQLQTAQTEFRNRNT